MFTALFEAQPDVGPQIRLIYFTCHFMDEPLT
jgi:hypothetical protein